MESISFISYSEYWGEVESLAENLMADVRGEEFDDFDVARDFLYEHTWETIDQHEYVIYTAKSLWVEKWSDNDSSDVCADWGVENPDSAQRAFACLRADVDEKTAELFEAWKTENFCDDCDELNSACDCDEGEA